MLWLRNALTVWSWSLPFPFWRTTKIYSTMVIVYMQLYDYGSYLVSLEGHYTMPSLSPPNNWCFDNPILSHLLHPLIFSLIIPNMTSGNDINDWNKQSSAYFLRIRSVCSSYIRCAAMHGRSRMLLACAASSLGGVPEQIFQGGRIQVPALWIQSYIRKSDTWVNHSYLFIHASIHAYVHAYTPSEDK